MSSEPISPPRGAGGAAAAGAPSAGAPSAGAPSAGARRARRSRLLRALTLALTAGALGLPIAQADAQTRRRTTARRAAAPARAEPAITTPRSAAALRADLAHTVQISTRSGSWGVMVVSLTRGDTLFAHNVGAPMQPASTMKLLTAALALERFGPEHRFRTQVLRDGPVRPDGTLEGNLILRGTGDPAFSGRFLPGGPSSPVDHLAAFVAGAGIRRVTGGVIGDASAFEARPIPAGWKDTYLHLAYAAPVSALSINENVVWISVAPGANGRPQVALEPASSGVPVINAVQQRAGSGASVSVIRRKEGGMTVRGWIGARSPSRRYQMVIDDPAPFTAGAFREALIRKGIEVAGGVRLGLTPEDADTVAALPSPPLSQLVSVMNRESVNHYAELIFRNAARGERGEVVGSAAHGDEALRELFTSRLGAPSNAVTAADGSGLSLLDRVTPRAMTQLLGFAHEAPWSSAFHASLPVAGESELLRTRMRNTPAQGNLHAKTGTTDEVIGLAGYTTALNGEVLAFTFIYNGTDRWNARAAIDVMGATMSGFAREQ